MEEELIEEVDWEGNTIAVHPRSWLRQCMFPHKASLVIPKGKDGNYIISKRAADQYPFPDTWVCAVGGKVSQGESYLEAAIRESREEIGTELEVIKVARFRYDNHHYKAIFTVYTTKRPVDVQSLTPNPKEVQGFREISLQKLKDEIEQTPERFAPTFCAAAKAFIYALENQE